MKVPGLEVGKQLYVGAPTDFDKSVNPVGLGKGEKMIRGASYLAGPVLIGNPASYTAGENYNEANVMIARSGNPEAEPDTITSIFKVTNKKSQIETRPKDIMLGDDGGGEVGIWIDSSTYRQVNDDSFTIVTPNLELTGDFTQVGDYTLTGDISQTGDYTVTGDIDQTGDNDLSGSLVAGGEVKSNGGGHVLSNKKNLPFDMPHPNRKGWRLRHVCIEGPEIAVYCRGKIGEDGIINLPSFWEGLVDTDDITINLTPHGNWQELYVKEIVDGKQIVVVNNITGGKVNADYHIIGRRLDDDLIVEYEGETHEDYPGGNEGYSFSWENDNMERLVKEVARERLDKLQSSE